MISLQHAVSFLRKIKTVRQLWPNTPAPLLQSSYFAAKCNTEIHRCEQRIVAMEQL